ncbi:MAG: lipid II flippase Amj family protein [Desulfotomaculaceae bacterium]|nr:lipid II flippase Amj family protein [Desulfotomaculaceae bacterium]
MERYLYNLILLTFIIHLIDTLSYSVRLSAVKSGQFALSTSLFNVFVLISRTANMLQGPLIGGLIGASIVMYVDPINEIHKVIFASTGGTLAGIILIPTFLKVFHAAVARLESTGSVSLLVIQSLSIYNIKLIAKNSALPSKRTFESIRWRDIPKRLLIFNTLLTAIYTVGVLAAFYSATLVAPEYQLAASSSSGMINGVATILLTLVVDPRAAIITDQAFRGDRPYSDVKTLVVLLIGAKLLGTLLGQVILAPAASLLANFYQ